MHNRSMKIKSSDKHGTEYELEEHEYIYRKAVYGFYIKNNKVLMIKDTAVGRWELPGGGVDEGESDFAALKREFLEETGLEIVKGELELIEYEQGYYYSLYDKEAWKTDRYYYKVKIKEGVGELLKDGNNVDVTAARFIPVEELSSLKVGDKDLEVIEKMLTSL